MLRNISTKGRLIRAGLSLFAGATAVLLWPTFKIGGTLVAAAAAFAGFESARGWCALRACGFKTKW